MGVSVNGGTPRSSILIGFSIINHPFWGTTIFGNTHIVTIHVEPNHTIHGYQPPHIGKMVALLRMVPTIYKVYMGLIIKEPPSQKYHHFPYEGGKNVAKTMEKIKMEPKHPAFLKENNLPNLQHNYVPHKFSGVALHSTIPPLLPHLWLPYISPKLPYDRQVARH